MNEAAKPAELLLLRIIDKVPALANSYSLEKILSWAELFGYQRTVTVKQLAAKGRLDHELHYVLILPLKCIRQTNIGSLL